MHAVIVSNRGLCDSFTIRDDGMDTELVKTSERDVLTSGNGLVLPTIIADAGERASRRFVEFFTAAIRNGNTRQAYARAVGDFVAWCQQHDLTLAAVEPVHVAAYIEGLTQGIKDRQCANQGGFVRSP
jgi:hypothetical protein